ncbi:MAG: hypothetical protein U1D30_01835 [Planctomycetota bacterium]
MKVMEKTKAFTDSRKETVRPAQLPHGFWWQPPTASRQGKEREISIGTLRLGEFLKANGIPFVDTLKKHGGVPNVQTDL